MLSGYTVSVFTGLVEDVGRVVALSRSADAQGMTLAIAPSRFAVSELSLGESVAIDGVCLTVTHAEGGRFTVLAGPETLARTTLGTLTDGGQVNLERALRPTDRLGGHIVAGHVDGVGEIASKVPTGPAVEVTFKTPPDLLRYVVEKGSIAVDGISLTVNRVDEYSFAVALIPHTMEMTTLAGKGVGARVNLEVDVVGKYVEKFVGQHMKGRST
jgi:riboflavin synthase